MHLSSLSGRNSLLGNKGRLTSSGRDFKEVQLESVRDRDFETGLNRSKANLKNELRTPKRESSIYDSLRSMKAQATTPNNK